MTQANSPLVVETIPGGLVLTLNRPPQNILDAEMIQAIRAAVKEHGDDPHLKGIVIAASGDNFSFGASVEEHRKDQAGPMLEAMHGMVKEILALNVPVVAAVRGLCLGGGLELALTASWIFASPDAKLGQPEIKLGVIAPVASVLIPLRIGQTQAEGILLSGAMVGGERAHQIGLVDVLAEDPTADAMAFFEKQLQTKSASSLRLAVKAARAGVHQRTGELLDELEHLYIDVLMETHDANEGIEAFLAKRKPDWRDA